MSYVSIERLLEAGAHFGHLTRRWNPKMRGFIFIERNGIHIIDLRKTQILIDVARDAATEIAGRGLKFLFVGTKKQAKDIVSDEAVRCGAHFVADRWLGGMLTNFSTIRKSIRKLESIEKMEVDGTFDKISKKERLTLTRERDKLIRVFGGIRDMSRLPGALFVVDVKKENIAVNEAKKLGIPVFAIVDTNCDPTVVDYPIPANDDSIKTIDIILKSIADGLVEGGQTAKIKRADASASGEREFKEGDGGVEVNEQGKVQRKMRERKRRTKESENAEAATAESAEDQDASTPSPSDNGTENAPAEAAAADAPAPDTPAPETASSNGADTEEK